MPDPIAESSLATPVLIWVVIPIFNDWKSAEIVLTQLAAVAKHENWRAAVILVNDGSTEPISAELSVLQQSAALPVLILNLQRNLGHQRAIDIALALTTDACHQNSYIVVMDGDGEDRPENIPLLVQTAIQHGGRKMVFARRAKRSESATFRLGLIVYKALHRLLTGTVVRVGNFSCLPVSIAKRLVKSPDLWSHFAAAAEVSRLPMITVPVDRGRRLMGRSKMNLEALVHHGLSAISIYADRVAVRIFLALCAVVFLAMSALVALVIYRINTPEPLPGPTALGAVAIAVLAINALALATIISLGMIKTGRGIAQNPARDWDDYCENGAQIFQRISHFSSGTE